MAPMVSPINFKFEIPEDLYSNSDLSDLKFQQVLFPDDPKSSRLKFTDCDLILRWYVFTENYNRKHQISVQVEF